MKKVKNIAIVTFDSKKTDLIEWSYFNKELLLPHRILALGFAASIIEGTLNKKIDHLENGKTGGYRQLCNLINEGKIDAVIIFGEANEILEAKDLNAVFEAAVSHNIIIAGNRTTADFVLYSSLIQAEYTIHTKEKKLSDNEASVTTASARLAKAS